MAEAKAKMVQRHQRVAFMNTGTTEEPVFTRMTGFTSMTNNKNPKEYARQYVDRSSEDTDVVGYSPATDYSFDRHTNTPVHDMIAKVHDGELTGSDALVEILVVDLFTADADGKCEARKRTYAIIPNADGDGTDALVYTGSLKSKSEPVKGTATLSDNEQTAIFTAETATTAVAEEQSEE